MPKHGRRLPARPLQTALRNQKQNQDLSWEQLATQLGVRSRTLFRLMQARDVSWLVADRIACRLGSHPSLLWPDEWPDHPDERRGNGDRTAELLEIQSLDR